MRRLGPACAPGTPSNDQGRIIRHAYGTKAGYAALMQAAHRAWRALFAAAGAALPLLLPEAARAAGLRLSLQTLAHLDPPLDWGAAPMLLGRLPGHPAGGVYVLPPRPGTRLKLGDYDTSEPGEPFRDDPGHVAPHRRAALLDAAARVIEGFAAYRVTALRRRLYVMAPGDRFVLREIEPGLLFASACSGHGFKLAALMGLGLARFASGRLDAGDLARWAAGEALPEAVPVPA